MVTANCADGQATLWDVPAAKKLGEWRFATAVNDIAFAPDGRHLATANANGTVFIIRIAAASSRALSAGDAKKQQ
jgi:hypothetical protein